MSDRSRIIRLVALTNYSCPKIEFEIYFSFLVRVVQTYAYHVYRIVPNCRALPNKDAPCGLRKAKTDENEQNCPKILNNCPIFNPKPLLESCHLIRSDIASAPCATIRDNTVIKMCNDKVTRLFVIR